MNRSTTQTQRIPVKKAFIPLNYIDGLSYGPWDFILKPFQSWLRLKKNIGVKVIILPTPKDQYELFNLGTAGSDIREEARKLDLVVVSEAKLRKKGLLGRKPEVVVPPKPFSFPSPFSVLIMNDERTELRLAEA